jgi:cytochrome b561
MVNKLIVMCIPIMQEKYSIYLRLLHWFIAFLFLCELFVGFIMSDMNQSNFKMNLYDLHKSLGFSILILFIIRVFCRIFTTAPKIPEQISCLEKKLSKIGHFSIYLFSFIMALSGFFGTFFKGYSINLFNLIEMKSFVAVNNQFGGFLFDIHEVVAQILIILLFIHVSAVFKHIIKDKVNLLKRIF